MPRASATKKATTATQKKTKTTSGARLRTHVRVMLDDEIALGPGKADLLEAIREHGSISAAGKKLGMSYRRAWLLVDAMNRCFKSPLVITAAGGAAGGGAQLSPTGHDVLARYRILEEAVAQVTGRGFDELKPLLRRTPQSAE